MYFIAGIPDICTFNSL